MTGNSGLFKNTIGDRIDKGEEISLFETFMTGNEYQRLAARTINQELSEEDQIYHAVFGMSSEAGEVAGLFQKIYQGHVFDEEHLKKELGDLLWFIAEFCTANGWNLEDVMQLNIDKLMARFPEGFDAEHSLNRKEGDI